MLDQARPSSSPSSSLIRQQPPDCLVVFDSDRKSSAILKVHRLQILIVSLVDSDMPIEYFNKITYLISCNNSSAKFVYLFCNLITKTFLLQQKQRGEISAEIDTSEQVGAIEEAKKDELLVVPYEFLHIFTDLLDLNVQPREQLASLALLTDSDDRPRSSSVDSLLLSDFNDEPRNPSSTVISLDLFPDLNDETTDIVDFVDLNQEQRNPSVVTLDLFPPSKEDDKEERSTTQRLAISTTPSPCSLNNNVVSCCSSTTTQVQEETVLLQSKDIVPTIMDFVHTPHVPSVSIKRKPMDIDYSSPHDPNPKAPKRKKNAAHPSDRRKPRKSFAPQSKEQCEKCGAMDKTLCRNMKVSIMLTVKNIPPKEAGSLGDIEELAEEFMQQLDMRMKGNSQQGVSSNLTDNLSVSCGLVG
ncbi:hypothetical protein ACLB2K_005373 [Fragaria x ananassa]